jgi:hypothetical protein
MGSGGSNKVLGNFAPTAKTSKNDSKVEVGNGQLQTKDINQKLRDLPFQHPVQAIFLNESYYRRVQTSGAKQAETTVRDDSMGQLRFLGYFQLTESRVVVRDEYKDLQDEFNNPSEQAWQFISFRLHSHLRIEAKPLLSSFGQVSDILDDDKQTFKSIVLNHDDHGDILFDKYAAGAYGKCQKQRLSVELKNGTCQKKHEPSHRSTVNVKKNISVATTVSPIYC